MKAWAPSWEAWRSTPSCGSGETSTALTERASIFCIVSLEAAGRSRVHHVALAALLLLIIFASPAAAQSAWVLWQEATGPPTYESSTWTVSTWETKEACEQVLAEKVRSYSAPLRGGEVTVDDRTGRSRVWWRTRLMGGLTLVTEYTYTCAPDTVDPRGPRGGRP